MVPLQVLSKGTGVAEPLLAPPTGPADTPPAPPDEGPRYTKFSSSLCDCCVGEAALPICMVSWLLPCFAHGLAANGASGGKGVMGPLLMWFGFSALPPISAPAIFALATLTRCKLRRKYGMPPRPFAGVLLQNVRGCFVCFV